MMVLGLAAGYVVTLLTSMILTFAITMSLPKFVEADHLIRPRYKFVHEGFWLVAATAGGYVTALVVKDVHPQVTELALLASLIWVLWSNSWEARQRGTAHQILITALSVFGVVGGYVLSRSVV